RAVLPFLHQHPTAAPFDAEFLQRAGQRVEAGGDDDNVERGLPAARANALRRDLFDWAVGARIYQFHVLLVEGLEVVGVQWLALGAVGVSLWGQFFGGRRVVDD